MILLIYGAGGLGREYYDLASRINDNRWEKVLFVDDGLDEKECYFTRIIHFESITSVCGGDLSQVEAVVAVGEPKTRELLYNKLKKNGIRLANLIDKSALISPTVELGEGVVICEMCTLHANVKLADNVLIQPHAVLGHDIEVGKHSVLSAFCAPGGHTIFGERCYAGMHAAIREGLTVGDDAIIGMGAVVARNVEAYTTVVGNPARTTIGNENHRVFKGCL